MGRARSVKDLTRATRLPPWKRLGTGDEITAQQAAADAAHSGRATIALWNPTGGIGHVALVLPGELRRSGSWNMDVVRIAQTRLNSADNAFIGCHLGHGFGADKKADVVFWSKG